MPPPLRKLQEQQKAREVHNQPIRRGSGSQNHNSSSYSPSNGGYGSRPGNHSGEHIPEPAYSHTSGERGVHSTQSFFKPRGSHTQQTGRWAGLADNDPHPTRYGYRPRFTTENRLGFHGNLNPSKFLEKELFDATDHVKEGINFENVKSFSDDCSSLVR